MLFPLPLLFPVFDIPDGVPRAELPNRRIHDKVERKNIVTRERNEC